MRFKEPASQVVRIPAPIEEGSVYTEASRIEAQKYAMAQGMIGKTVLAFVGGEWKLSVVGDDGLVRPTS